MNFKQYFRQLGIPGAISSLSLLAAWIAIVFLLNNDLKFSVIAAVMAFVLDSLDGYVARRTNKVSELGRQLDSMVDLVGYSVYAALLTHLYLLPGLYGMIAGYVIVLFGILRLIRFNIEGFIEDEDVRYYKGVVVCHLSLAAIVLLIISVHLPLPSIPTVIFLVVLSVLQISNIKTRKTRMLPFWYIVALFLVIGAVRWLP